MMVEGISLVCAKKVMMVEGDSWVCAKEGDVGGGWSGLGEEGDDGGGI